ncbi:hypothetical protein G8C93_00135 [Cellulosimicrobium cellulans]|uniref:hypothetical protein n=1 Tax=Cellulosimicrobium cellulans TaxID=1710 RepID=UPI001883E2EA|nr:hypothetical protein [Cellulosimicrobium cellulans]MBE9924302.1 hypothetical protein [Cellulosimicrobium cellulans]
MSASPDPSRPLADLYLRIGLGWDKNPALREALSAISRAWAPPAHHVSPILESLNAMMSHLRRELVGQLDVARLFARSLPPNLRALGSDLAIVAAIEMGRDEGISLYGVPRAAVARRFLRARDAPARRRVLGEAAPLILGDCGAALDGVTARGLEFPVVMLRDAIGAARAGHLIAAQAAATAALDGATRYFLDDKKIREAVTRTGREENRNQSVLDGFRVREALALMPVYGSHVNYRHWEDPVPWAYSRHATTHSAAGRQFSKRNAVQAVLVATGFLLWVDDMSKGHVG